MMMTFGVLYPIHVHPFCPFFSFQTLIRYKFFLFLNNIIKQHYHYTPFPSYYSPSQSETPFNFAIEWVCVSEFLSFLFSSLSREVAVFLYF